MFDLTRLGRTTQRPLRIWTIESGKLKKNRTRQFLFYFYFISIFFFLSINFSPFLLLHPDYSFIFLGPTPHRPITYTSSAQLALAGRLKTNIGACPAAEALDLWSAASNAQPMAPQPVAPSVSPAKKASTLLRAPASNGWLNAALLAVTNALKIVEELFSHAKFANQKFANRALKIFV